LIRLAIQYSSNATPRPALDNLDNLDKPHSAFRIRMVSVLQRRSQKRPEVRPTLTPCFTRRAV